jgi:Tfp pilus assembly protein PilX
MLRRRPATSDPCGRDRDGGSIIVALTVIMVLMLIASAMAARVIGAQMIVVARQNGSSAVEAADAGVADALFRLDQGTAETGSGGYFCVNANDTNCVAGSVPGTPGVSYVARQNSATKWTIQSLATIRGQSAAVQQTVIRTPAFPYALFGNTSLTFNGNATGSFSTYNDAATSSSTNPNTNGAVSIGSNGTITCGGGIGSNVTTVYYGGVGSLGSSCGNPQSVSTPYPLPPPTAPTSNQGCPNDGQLGSGFSGAPSTLGSAGSDTVYVCNQPVTISGLLNVSGTVSFYIMLDPSVYNSSTNVLTIAPSSYVNDMSDYCAANSGASGCSPTPDLPVATSLQIYTNSNGTVGNDNGQGYGFGGILYAPQASLTQDGCKSQYYGALVINTLTCNGGPHLYVSYDSALSTFYGPWSANNYLEINPSSVTIP